MDKKAKSRATHSSPDAVELLIADHKAVQKVFKDFEKLKEKGSSKDKAAIVEQVCRELTIHAQLEEEIFYPAVRSAIHDDGLIDEAVVEHSGVKNLIAQLESMSPGDALYDAKVTVLGENIDHHVKEEQDEMFPKAKKAKVDLRALGEEMLRRKKELQEELEAAH
ncbi:MAG TPA: hemerythrin domain-containing protein [Burkholderiales bacterium]|nr:hemerythrin domain-containing protein [Burkholderiales bacterium]